MNPEDAERYAWFRSLARRGMLEPFVALNQLDHLRSDEKFDAKVDVARRWEEKDDGGASRLPLRPDREQFSGSGHRL